MLSFFYFRIQNIGARILNAGHSIQDTVFLTIQGT